MNNPDQELIRKLMYADDDDSDTEKTSNKKNITEVKITSAPKNIIIESGGQRHQVPTMNAFNAVLTECKSLRNSNRDAQTTIKKLTETVKKMDAALRNVERELANKADKYET